MKSLSDIARIFRTKNYIYILTHRYPDGDTLGAAYALCRALQLKNKKVKVLCSDEIPKRYKFMEKYVEKQDFPPRFIMSVDIADINQLGEGLMGYADKIDLCIDHHMTNKNYAEVTFVDPASASVSEIVYELLKEMQVSLDKEMSECIYVGVSTDTGCFKYSNVTSRTHRIAAELIEKGIDLSTINKVLFDTKSKRMLVLESMMYNSLEYYFQGKCAVMFVTLDMMKESGVSENQLEGIASIPRSIDGVDIGVTIREKRQGMCKVSVRTCNNINAVSICEEFGGGGHSCASGFTACGNIKEIRSQILRCIKEKVRL